MLAAHTLDRLVEEAGALDGVHKDELSLGDQVIVTTRNSSYAIYSLGDGRYSVSGGWFDRRGASPATTTINGCTWGGTAIHTELVACTGLRLEFGNKVVTTRIRSVRLIRSEASDVRARVH
jgi:hypothetical protein